MNRLGFVFWNFVAISSLAQDLPQELFLFGTYRDFLPAACLHQRDPAGAAIVNNAWSNNGGLGKTGRCNRLLSDIVWGESIRSGQISGHPDFEASGFFGIQNDCTTPDPSTGLIFPVGSCIFQFDGDGSGFRHSTVGRELIVGENGLPKPQYCDESEGGESRCGDTSGKQTQSQKKFFDNWYNDDETFNKRVGHRLKLKLGSEAGSNQYTFDSSVDPAAADFPLDRSNNFFGPLDMFKIGGSAEVDIETPLEDAPVWPQSDVGLGSRGFWLTTELHTTFEFRSDADMKFKFSGDDDFWAFIDGQLTVDVGGMHAKRTKQVDLNEVVNGRTIGEELGLEDGEVYTLDIFHAERQTVGSNFELSTTLFAACNVVQSGRPSFNFRADEKPELDAKFLSRGMSIDDENRILIQNQDDVFSSGFIFSTQEQNIARGFDSTFNVIISKNSTFGFAFVLQAVGINDLPLVSGDSFNIEGMQKSLAVVFDLCVDREANDCKDQEVRVHHADYAFDGNSAKNQTMRVNEKILRNLKRNESFPVQIIYFGGKPDFLEVYVNNSLYLRQDGFGSIIEDLEIGGAHVGFTATSSNLAADIVIENFIFNTVQVEPPLTVFSSNSSASFEILTADGLNVSEGIQIKTFDFCQNELEAGSLEDLVDAYFIMQIDDEDEFSNDTKYTERANVIDNGDGTYQIALQTDVPGSYSLVVAFGEGCFVDFTNESIPILRSTNQSSASCFFEEFNNGSIIVQAFPPEIAPSASPVEFFPNEDNQGEVRLISAIIGGMALIGLVAMLALFGFYRKWNKTKGYIEEGNLFRLEMNTEYNVDDEYQKTGKQLMESQKEILSLQASAKVNGRAHRIKTLERENTEMKAIIQKNKAMTGVSVPRSSKRRTHVPKTRKPMRTEF